MKCDAKTFFGVINAFRSLNLFSLLPLSRQEYMVMFVIAGQRKTNPAVSRTLRGLENDGYICREVCRTDRRNTYVTLTAAGEAEVQRANQLLEDFHRGIQKRFTQEEADQLMELLQRLYAAASEELEEMKGERATNG